MGFHFMEKNQQKKKCPCENCICFAMCKSRYVTRIAGLVYMEVAYMYLNCSLFVTWYLETEVNQEKELYPIFGLTYYGNN